MQTIKLSKGIEQRGSISGGIYSAFMQPCLDSLTAEPQAWNDRVNNSKQHNTKQNKCYTFKEVM